MNIPPYPHGIRPSQEEREFAEIEGPLSSPLLASVCASYYNGRKTTRNAQSYVTVVDAFRAAHRTRR